MTDPTNIYQTVPVRPVARKPPLTQRQKSGARLAGIIGFLMLSLGYGMLAILIVILIIVATITLIFQIVGRTSGDADWFRQLVVYAGGLQPEQWIIPLIVLVAVGALILVASLIVSARILRAHDVHRPWPVTWAGAGVAIVGSWVGWGVMSVPLQLVGAGGNLDSMGGLPIRVIVSIISFVVGIAATAVIGWLSWWWMAHVMRPMEGAAQVATAEPITSTSTETLAD